MNGIGHRSASVDDAVTAVFFVDGSRLTRELILRWRAAGHGIAAIVVGPGRRRPGRWAFRRAAASTGAPVRFLRRRIDWQELAAWIASHPADVLISYAFPRLVPAAVLSLFPCGGVNFHPALLPYYRGPHPMPCMVADGAWPSRGGMTLHVMSNVYDQGDIIAATAFVPSDWQSGAHLHKAIAQSLSEMAVDVIPKFCRGLVALQAQPAGEFPDAQYTRRAFHVMPDWTIADLSAAGLMLNRRPGLFVNAQGRQVRIGRVLQRHGPPEGRAPQVRLLTVDLDCVDGRVRVARANRLGKIADSIRRRITRQTPERQMQPIRFKPALPQAGGGSRNFAETISARPATSRPARSS
jgi:methionyl-tRNA formyltransferase